MQTESGRASALRNLASISRVPLFATPSPLEEMARLRTLLGIEQRLLVKRDDAIPFGFGGNKVRKLEYVAAAALAAGADTLVTTGGVQSNHARATAAVAAKLGMHCHIVANGNRLPALTGNALLNEMLAAKIEYVAGREHREPALTAAMHRLRNAGNKPYLIPLGASTPLGAMGYVRAVGELLEQMTAPDVIVHASSSGGTQAGLIAGCVLHNLPTRVVGISSDTPADELADIVRGILAGICGQLGIETGGFARRCHVEVDDGFVGAGYGIPSAASSIAQTQAARSQALFVDHVYTAKAFAGFLSYIREGRLGTARRILFWHTGGQTGLFA